MLNIKEFYTRSTNFALIHSINHCLWREYRIAHKWKTKNNVSWWPHLAWDRREIFLSRLSAWLKMTFKAIGGVRVKKSCWPHLKDLQRKGTDAFYWMSKFSHVQKLLHFEVRNFGRISYKKMRKIWIFGYFRKIGQKWRPLIRFV